MTVRNDAEREKMRLDKDAELKRTATSDEQLPVSRKNDTASLLSMVSKPNTPTR